MRVLTFPRRQRLRMVLAQPRRAGSDVGRRPRRDPLVYVVLLLNAFLLGGILGMWWASWCIGRGW